MPETPEPAPDKSAPVPLKELAAEKTGALGTDDSVQTAGERMRARAAPSWPVAEDLKLVGMIDEENPDWQVGGHGHDPNALKVGEIMNRRAIFCYEDENCASAQRLMDEHGLHYLPVVDRQMRIVGIFSREEIEEKDTPRKSPGGTRS